VAEQVCGVGGVNELSKIASITAELRKSADRMWEQLEDMWGQLDGLNQRLAKLESKEDWPGFYEATFQAPGVANLHPAPVRVQ
jgi:hypothetical protein